jgi:pilus assembly protein Flp/PilA
MTTFVIKTLRAAIKDRKAITALEYGLLASLIVVGIIAGISLIGNKLKNTFNTIASSL